MALIRNDDIETVLIEESDERLAASMEALRTGQPAQSVAARRTFAVPRDVAQKMVEDAANENIYVGRFGATYAGHLEDYHKAIQDPNFVRDSNEEKARQHAEYSAELVRKQMEDNQRVNELIAEGYDASLAVQQANIERAREHEAASADYEGIRQKRIKDGLTNVPALVDEMVRVVRAEDLSTKTLDERVALWDKVTPSFSANEDAARAEIVTHDKIIATEEPYEANVMSHEELQKRDRPGIEILESAGSPEELQEKTALAQIAANNPTKEAVKAIEAIGENVAARDGEEITNEPGRVLREAEEAVDPLGRPMSDEMRENPNK